MFTLLVVKSGWWKFPWDVRVPFPRTFLQGRIPPGGVARANGTHIFRLEILFGNCGLPFKKSRFLRIFDRVYGTVLLAEVFLSCHLYFVVFSWLSFKTAAVFFLSKKKKVAAVNTVMKGLGNRSDKIKRPSASRVGGGGKQQGLGPRNDVLTTCKAIR